MASSSSSSTDEQGAITGINVTPLVDVTLVLLIVFLVTAKAIVSQGIPLEVPKAPSAEVVQSVLSVSIDEHGQMTLDGRMITPAELTTAARAAHDGEKPGQPTRAVIRASTRAQHGDVVRAIDALRRADVTRIAFAVDKSKNAGDP